MYGISSVWNSVMPTCQEPAKRSDAAAGPDQQRIAGGLAKSRQHPAGRRRAELQPRRRPGDTAFTEQRIERDEQVEIRDRHALMIAHGTASHMAPDAAFDCKCCIFRHVKAGRRLSAAPEREQATDGDPDDRHASLLLPHARR